MPHESCYFEIVKYPSQTTIKWEESQWTHWALLCRVPSGDKTFSGFQKGRLKVVILKVSNTLLRPQLKWEESKWTPLVSAFAEVLRGIKLI